MLTSSDLTALLTWHQHPKVAGMKEEAKFIVWLEIKNHKRPPPLLKIWTNADEEQLLEAQSNIIDMAHTALGHLEVLKKREFCWWH